MYQFNSSNDFKMKCPLNHAAQMLDLQKQQNLKNVVTNQHLK